MTVTYEDVASAAERLEGVANRTPVVTSRTLDERLDARLFLKCESFQRMGAFKFRGAYNAISRLSADERRRGVITYSSGNHAQAVALASRLVGTTATVVMPADAPPARPRATGRRSSATSRRARTGRRWRAACRRRAGRCSSHPSTIPT